MLSTTTKILALVALAAGLSACDKCGDRIRLVPPSIQKACGDNSLPH